jgi:nucleolar protein 9
MSAAYPPAQSDKAFFGMLDEEEQEFFKRADHMLDADAFGNPEERTAFVTSIFNEADGKELKIAQSQSCSRVLEKLIRVANRSQLKNLFQKFSGKYVHPNTHHPSPGQLLTISQFSTSPLSSLRIPLL